LKCSKRWPFQGVPGSTGRPVVLLLRAVRRGEEVAAVLPALRVEDPREAEERPVDQHRRPHGARVGLRIVADLVALAPERDAVLCHLRGGQEVIAEGAPGRGGIGMCEQPVIDPRALGEAQEARPRLGVGEARRPSARQLHQGTPPPRHIVLVPIRGQGAEGVPQRDRSELRRQDGGMEVRREEIHAPQRGAQVLFAVGLHALCVCVGG
jgi:hypothetical protein